MLSKEELLKIRLLADGIRINEKTKKKIEKDIGQLSLFDYCTTQGVILQIVNTDIFVNADFIFDFSKKSKAELKFTSNKLFVIYDGIKYPVKIFPAPSYFNKKNSKGSYLKNFIATHGDRARISPISGCSFACQFCDSPKTEYQLKEIDDLIESIKVAVKDKILPAKHLLISGGTPKVEHRKYLINVFKIIAKKSPIPVDIMVAAWVDEKILQNLKKWGVQNLSINIEIWDKKIASKLIVGKNKIGREKYLYILKKAVKIFGRGKIRSVILVGIEPTQSTLKGIEALSKIGVLPVLSPFRAVPGTPLENHPRPSFEELKNVYERSKRIVKKNGVVIGPRCIPCQHNALAFPDDSGEYFYS